MSDTDWAEEIRRLRRFKSLKQSALADVLGVDQATVSRWEHGTSIPGLRMQRRLLDLLRRPVQDEFLLKHAVTISLGAVVLSNYQRVMQAVSAGYAQAHGLPQAEMPGRCNKGKFGAGEAAIEQLKQRGFYRGEVASVTAISRVPSLSGHRPLIPVKIVFTPVRVADEFLLRGDRLEIPESEFDQELTRNGGMLRFVMVDDLIR